MLAGKQVVRHAQGFSVTPERTLKMKNILALITPDAVVAFLALLTIGLPAVISDFRSARRIIGLAVGLICSVIIRVCNPSTFGIATGMVMVAIYVLVFCLIATGFVPWLYRTLVPQRIRNGLVRGLVVAGYILAIVGVILGIGLLVAGLATV